MTTPQWSPASVLQLYPNFLGFTCIGHAKTQGRRCRNPIAYANRREAANILLEMSRQDPLQSQRLESQLEELASRLLCRRWHQDQAVEMKRQWRRHIADFQAAETARRAERSRTVERASDSAHAATARTRVASVRTEWVTSSVMSSVTHESSLLAIISIVIREELGGRENSEPNGEEPRQQTDSGPDSSSQQEAPSRETSNIPPSTSSADEPTTHTPAPSLQEHPIATREAQQEAANEAEPSQHSPTASTPAQQPQHADSHPAHQDRRAIEGDCSICCEDLSSGGTTTWCRAQCRQNFHAGCIELWHASQEADGRAKTCPYCRTEWPE